MLRHTKSFTSIFSQLFYHFFTTSTILHWKRYLCILLLMPYFTWQIIIHNNHRVISLRVTTTATSTTEHSNSKRCWRLHEIFDTSKEFLNKSHWKIWRMNFDLCRKFSILYTKSEHTRTHSHKWWEGRTLALMRMSVIHSSIHVVWWTSNANTQIQLIVDDDDELCVPTWQNWLRCKNTILPHCYSTHFLSCIVGFLYSFHCGGCVSRQSFLKYKTIQSIFWKL